MLKCKYCNKEVMFSGMDGRKVMYARTVTRSNTSDLILVRGKPHKCGFGMITRQQVKSSIYSRI